MKSFLLLIFLLVNSLDAAPICLGCAGPRQRRSAEDEAVNGDMEYRARQLKSALRAYGQWNSLSSEEQASITGPAQVCLSD